MTGPNQKTRPRPPILKALGGHEPPARLEVDHETFSLGEVLKHDSWAATALYVGPGERRIVCKFHRQQPLGIAPLRWLGRLLARRERHFLCQLSHIPGIPRLYGTVTVDGKSLPHAVAREYVPGRPLGNQEHVPDDFFPRLAALLAQIHGRNIAYVDLHKRENVIVGADGAPYLIDFQISYQRRTRIPGLAWMSRRVLSMLQATDDFCLEKLRVRFRPDQIPAIRAGMAPRPPWWIVLHRLVAVPFRTLRRRLLVLIGVRSGRGMAHSEQFAEDALRRPGSRRAA